MSELRKTHYNISIPTARAVSHSCPRIIDIRARQHNTERTQYEDGIGKDPFLAEVVVPGRVEQYQTEDGRIMIPKVLQPFMDNQEFLEPLN